MPLRWGILSTANITDKLLDSGTDQEFVAVGSRDARPGRGLRAREGHRARPRLLRGAAGRPRGRRDLQPAAQRAARRVVDPRARGRQARAVREAAVAPPRGRRARLRRGRARGPRAGRGLHVAPPPAGRARARADRRRRDRRPARHPLALRLPRRRRRHPPPGRARRRRAHGRRLLLRQRLPHLRRRRARARRGRPRLRRRRRRRRARRDAALPGRRARPLRLRPGLSGRPRARGRRDRRLGPPRPIPWHGREAIVELRAADGSVERIEAGPANSYALELADFEAAVRGEREPLLGRDDALGQARTIAALYTSAERNAPCPIG